MKTSPWNLQAVMTRKALDIPSIAMGEYKPVEGRRSKEETAQTR
jgi:hypothetical protein